MTTLTGPSFDKIRDAFITVSGEPTGNGTWTTFLCPSHDDHDPSAGIKYVPAEHRTIVRCFAGCPEAAVLESLGLDKNDVFDRSAAHRHEPTVRSRSTRKQPTHRRSTTRHRLGKQIGWPIEVAQYVYRDIDGNRIGRVIRTRTEYERGSKKGFYLRQHDPVTETWPLGEFPPVIYRLPQIAAAIRDRTTIWVLEGEKDVDRAVGLGLVATCNPTGAMSFKPVHAQQLAGARRVVVVADRDRVGLTHARAVHALLIPIVDQVIVVQARDGKDFSDHVDAGHGLEDFDPVTQLGYTEVDVNGLIELPPERPVPDSHHTQDTDPRLQRLLASTLPPRAVPPPPAHDVAPTMSRHLVWPVALLSRGAEADRGVGL